MQTIPPKPVSGVRVVKGGGPRSQEEMDNKLVRQSASGGGYINEHDALERHLLRLLDKVREQREEMRAGRPAPKTKARECVPALVNLIFNVFPTEC